MPTRSKKYRFLIASGPTQEAIDPVRFITNRSTGVMGRYLAEAAKRHGHRVTWVDCSANPESAAGLERRLKRLLPKNDVLIMAAAVCDVRPRKAAAGKIKKARLKNLWLQKNPDILQTLSKLKKSRQVFIGFGLESARLVQSGYRKLKAKGLELIVLQKVTKKKTPFGDRPVDAVLLKKTKESRPLKAISKKKLAGILIQEAEALLPSNRLQIRRD